MSHEIQFECASAAQATLSENKGPSHENLADDAAHVTQTDVAGEEPPQGTDSREQSL